MTTQQITKSVLDGPVIKPASPLAPFTSPIASKQGFANMWHGLTISGLMRLLSLKPKWQWSSLPRVSLIAAISASNSLHTAAERLIYSRRVERTQIEHDPIFILGHWRSGTTLLHELMTMGTQFQYPNLYECLFASHFLWTQSWIAPLTGWTLPKTRPMDNVAASWDMPQEDEIALLMLCQWSPYLMMAFPANRDVYARFLEMTDVTPRQLEDWKQSLMLLMKKLTLLENKPIVMKSPSHTYRVPLLLEMFPRAKFLYIYREPYAVFRSGMHLRNTMFQENAFGQPDFSTNEDDCFALYDRCIRRYEETKKLIPAGQLHEVKFEHLEKDPYGEVKKIYEGLSLPGWSEIDAPLHAKVPELTSYKKNRFVMDRNVMEYIYERLRFVFDTYGYPSGLDTTVSPPARV